MTPPVRPDRRSALKGGADYYRPFSTFDSCSGLVIWQGRGHGFGLRLAKGKAVEGWQELFFAWAREKGLFE